MNNFVGLLVMSAAMGVYQGFNPAMGWLHATARGLERRSFRALLIGSIKFAWGHYLGMNVVLVPLACLLALTGLHPMLLMPWLGATFIIYGIFKLLRPAHPRLLARISPVHTVRWSFVMALTHCGSPLMMISPLLGMVVVLKLSPLHQSTVFHVSPFVYPVAALGITAAMALPQLIISVAIASAVYWRLGLKALTRYWFNFDLGWAVLFLLMGTMAIKM